MISLCITTYNRYDLTIESFRQVIDDPRISEIVIVDDCSKPDIFNLFSEMVDSDPNRNKIKLVRNTENLGMSRNKARAIELASNPWCILFDSDNVIDSSYVDELFNAWDLHKKFYGEIPPTKIYCPSFAKPQFDYRSYNGYHIAANNGRAIMKDSAGQCLMNTCNYVVNREEYLKVYEYNPEMRGTDTIWFNYLWLKAGNEFYVVSDMEYFHRVHAGSGFLEECDYNMKRAAEVKQLIQTLR